MNFGFVYVLTNEHIPGLIKIGMTTRPPSQRAAELSSSTGVPGDFRIEFYAEVENPHEVEQRVHKRLSDFRVSERREFFTSSVIDAVDEIYNTDAVITAYHSDVLDEAICLRRNSAETATIAIQKASA